MVFSTVDCDQKLKNRKNVIDLIVYFTALCSDYKWRRQNNSQASNSELSVNITNLRIFLSDVSLHELQNLLDYMYFGLVMLPFGNLEIFLNI